MIFESSHDRGAASFFELLTWGQYLIRNMTSKIFVRATRTILPCAINSLEATLLVKLSYYPGVPHVGSSTVQKRLSQIVQPLPWDDYFLSFHASGLLAFVRRTCRIQKDGMPLNCPLCLLRYNVLVSLCRGFVATELVSL